jgi:two-component system OmpR family sensor kinase
VNRLWVRLSLSFALVTAVAIGVVALLANQRAGEAFRAYLSYGDMSRYQFLIEGLADYYGTHGTWQGVEALVQHLERMVPMGMPMMDMRRGFTFPRDSLPQVILANADGHVVYDRLQRHPTRLLTRDEQAAAEDIVVGGEVVGRVVVVLPMRHAIPGPLEQAFFDRLRQLLLVGALLAGGLGLLLGLILSRSLSAPLQRLADAARGVANRDFSQRVTVGGSAEMAQVSSAFNDMAAALEQAEQLRRNLMADIAHELRTPLSVLQGNLQAILDGVYPLDRAEIAQLFDETRLLSRLVDDLRELALAEAGKLDLSLQPIAVGQLLHSTGEQFVPAFEAQGLEWIADIPNDLPMVMADPDRVSQIVRNLLVNALRHTPSGGSITVAASSRDDAVQITVADTGEGIAAADLPRVFDRFWRADPSRSRQTNWDGGTGLGLSIAQGLVQAQGGRIWVESALGEGSAFHFTLPTFRA